MKRLALAFLLLSSPAFAQQPTSPEVALNAMLSEVTTAVVRLRAQILQDQAEKDPLRSQLAAVTKERDALKAPPKE